MLRPALVRFGVLLVGVSCSSPTTTPATAAQPVDEADEPESESESDEVYPDWRDDAFSADLDGDGKPEKISWTCGENYAVAIGRARHSGRTSISELIGCQAAVVQLRPGTPQRQLMFAVDEHEEAGPDFVLVLAYRAGKMETIWQGSADITLRKSGTFVTETTHCDDDARHYETTSWAMTWDGTKLSKRRSVKTRPTGAEGCFDP